MFKMVEWWMSLNSDPKRLRAGLFMIIGVLSSLVSYFFIENKSIRNEYEKKLQEKNEKIEQLTLEKAELKANSNSDMLALFKGLLEESKAETEKQKTEVARQKAINDQQNKIIMDNGNYIDNTEKVLKKLNSVITKTQ